MKTKRKLWDICTDIYRELYQKSDPPADFDKLMEEGVTKKENWFMDYYMSDDKQMEIIQKHCKKHNLSKWGSRKVRFEILLGGSPSSVKE